MRFTVLGSGSTGNAMLIHAGETRVLVDAGLSAREIVRRLVAVGEDVSRLDGIIITHEHGDHAGGLRVLLNSVKCPVYISAETRDAYIRERKNLSSSEPNKRTEILKHRTVEIVSSQDFKIGQLDFHPFTIPHDAADNFGFTASYENTCLATVNDLGHITTLVRERLRSCAAIVIESNHDRDMLKACAVYPWELKQRIMSRTGHLSNDDIAAWLQDSSDGFDAHAAHIVLTHLSLRANNTFLAKLSAEQAIKMRAPLFQATTEVVISDPKEPTAWIEL